jgi:hypothetical protein
MEQMQASSKEIYRHKQRVGWILWGPIIIVITVAAYMGFGYRQYEGFVPVAILLVVTYFFDSLTVIVETERLRFFFGPGLVRKSFSLAEIKSCRAVRNKWYYGVGIHLTPHGMLYNISGLDGIELQLQSGRKVRIGTDEPQKLSELVNRLMREKERHMR